MNNFLNLFKNLMDTLEQLSYFHLIQCLTIEDPIAVREALNEIVKEGKKSAIPVIYLCWKKHPNFAIRQYSSICLSKLENLDNLENFLEKNHQNIEKNIEKLIKKYDTL